MSTTATLKSLNEQLLINFGNAADLLVGKELYAAVVKLPLIAFRSRRMEKKAIALIREIWAICEENCESGACGSKFYAQAAKIRDNLVRLDSSFEGLPFPFSMYRRWVKDSLHDWDDLAEDCLVFSDKEIRDSLSRIASIC